MTESLESDPFGLKDIANPAYLDRKFRLPSALWCGCSDRTWAKQWVGMVGCLPQLLVRPTSKTGPSHPCHLCAPPRNPEPGTMKISNLHDCSASTTKTTNLGRPLRRYVGRPPTLVDRLFSSLHVSYSKYVRVLKLDFQANMRCSPKVGPAVRHSSTHVASSEFKCGPSNRARYLPIYRLSRPLYFVAATLPSHSEPETDLLVSFSLESLLFSARLVLGLGRGW
jgi:hypothetical protein